MHFYSRFHTNRSNDFIFCYLLRSESLRLVNLKVKAVKFGWNFFKNVLLSYFNFKNLFLKKLDKKYKFSSINHSHLPIYMLPHYRFQKVICIKREPVTTLYSYYQKHQKVFFRNESFLEFIKNKRLKYLKRFYISLKNIPHYTVNYKDMRKKPNYTFNKILKY